MSVNFAPLDFRPSDLAVSSNMFKSNFLFHRNSTEKYEKVLDKIELTGFRWPGGTVTERYLDISNPDKVPSKFDDLGKEKFTSLSDFLQFCDQNSVSATIVIPSRAALDGNRDLDPSYIEDVKSFVRGIMEKTSEDGQYSNAEIYAFEIGNEYWGFDLTSGEYGKIANAISVATQEVLEEMNIAEDDQPNILVQMGVPVRGNNDEQPGGILYDLEPGSEKANALGLTERSFNARGELHWGEKIRVLNEEIISKLSPEAREAIDGLVEHYYFNRDDGYELPELHTGGQLVRSIDQKLQIWRDNGFEDQTLHITEWNVMAANINQLGQVGAGNKIAMFSYMTQMGVESAFSWPAQHNTTNKLAGNFDRDPELTALGGVTKIMAEYLPGTEFIENGFTHPDAAMFTFGNDDELFGFIISRTTEELQLEFDIRRFTNENAQATLKSLYVDSDGVHWAPGRGFVEVADYKDHDALSVIEIIDHDFTKNSTLSVDLRPFEILFFKLETPDDPVRNQIYARDFDNDVIGTFGADMIYGGPSGETIRAGFGNDIVFAGAGDDIIFAGRGDDTIWGGVGNDTIFGEYGDNVLGGGLGDDLIYAGSGNDTIWGGDGNDTIFGGEGNNLLGGGRGDDVIYGGSGNNDIWGGLGDDTIFGGSGSDTIWGGPGDDIIFGGRGDDTIGGGSGDDMIRGGRGDNLIWGGHGNDTLFGNDGDDTLYGGRGDDIIFGGGGDDLIYGGPGDDTIRGGAGNDTLYGGAGSDRFEFFANQDDNSIMDFSSVDGDVIALTEWLLPPEDRELTSLEIVEKYGSYEDGYLLLDFGSTRIKLYGLDEEDELDGAIEIF